MRTIAIAASLIALTATAAAEDRKPSGPDAHELADRASELKDKLAGQGYTVFVEEPFVIVGDSPGTRGEADRDALPAPHQPRAQADFFAKRPAKIIEVWLFKGEKQFRVGAKKFFGDAPDTPYGYYSSDASALIMNVNGLGTLSHELVHPYMEANFGEPASWFNEGLASLFERPSERKGHIIGLPNWRLPGLKHAIAKKTLPSLATMMVTTDDEFYGADWDAYAQARYLIYYLQEHGKLHAFYDAFRVSPDLTGQQALAAIVGEDLATFEPEWRAWVMQIKGDDK